MLKQSMKRSAEAAVLAFGEWTLDARTGALTRRDGLAVTLRPKTAAVLAEFVAAPGTLISREALLDSVWPGVAVTDDSVTQCIAEIRRALGSDGKLLRTAPRRGYVLDAPTPAPRPPPPVAVAAAVPARRRSSRLRMAVLIGGSVLAASGAVAVTAMQHRHSSGRVEAERLMREGRAIFYLDGDKRQIWPRARALFLRAAEADPTDPEPDAWAAFTYTNMIIAGHSVDRSGDLAQASRLADRAVALGPDLGQTWAARAGVYRLEKRYADALAAYRRAVNLDPAQLPAQANVGWMLVLLGQPQQALEPIRSVLAATRANHPFRPTWLCYLGMAKFAAGDGDWGIQAFRDAGGNTEAACATPADLAFYLVAALALDGQIEDARSLLTTTRRRWPAVTLQSLHDDAASEDPGYLAQREALFKGLMLSGFSDAPL